MPQALKQKPVGATLAAPKLTRDPKVRDCHCPRLFALKCDSADEEQAKPPMLDLIDDYLTQLANSFADGPTIWNDVIEIPPFEDN